MPKYAQHGLSQRVRIIRMEQEAGLIGADEFLVPADVGCNNYTTLRHRFERFERRHELRHACTLSRIHEDVDEIVVALNLVVRDTAGKYNVASNASGFGLPFKPLLFVSA